MRPYYPNAAYQQTKQANRMMTSAAASLAEYDGIKVNACHPGVVTSTLLNNLGMSEGRDSPEEGAGKTLVYRLFYY